MTWQLALLVAGVLGFCAIAAEAATNSSTALGQSNAVEVSANPPPATSSTSGGRRKWELSDILDTINLIIVVLIFYYGVVDQRKEKRRQGQRDVAIFWIQDLILSPNVQTLHVFFDKYEEALKTAAAETRPTKKKAQERIIAFKEDWHDVRQKVVDPLRMVSRHFNPLGDLLQEAEDLVTGEFQKIQGLAELPGQVCAADEMRRLLVAFF